MSALPLLENPASSPFPEFQKQEKENPSDREEHYRVVIMDNDYNTYQEVIDICMLALGVDFDHAMKIALAVDHNGRAEVFEGSLEDAREIAGIISRIGIEVQVLPPA